MRPPHVPPDFIIPDLPTYYDKVSKVYKLIKNVYGWSNMEQLVNVWTHQTWLATVNN